MYRLMSEETKKILPSRDVTFVEDSTPQRASVDGPSGRNKDNEVIIDQSTKTLIVVLDDEADDDGDHDAATTLKTKNGEKERVRPSSSVVEGDSSSEDRRYLDRVRRPPSEW